MNKNTFAIILGMLLLMGAVLAQNAIYSSVYTAPLCSSSASPCMAGSSLLMSKDNWSPAEPNQPNTIDNCTDGTSGSYGTDENVENVTVYDTSAPTSGISPGDSLNISIWMHCYSSSSRSNLVYSINASNASWTYLSQIACSAAGWEQHNFTMTLDGSFEGYSAIRAIADYNLATDVTCSTGNYGDNDDVVFGVHYITIDSPLNTTYPLDQSDTNWVWGNITVPTSSWCGYSLDGAANVTMANDTINTYYANVSGLIDGPHIIEFYCNNSVGSYFTNSQSFTVDTQPPNITLSKPINGSRFVPGESVELYANATDNILVNNISFYVNGSLIDSCGSSPCQKFWDTSLYGEGVYNVTAIATDDDGLIDTQFVDIQLMSNEHLISTLIDESTPDFKVTSSGGTEYESGEQVNLWLQVTNTTNGSPIDGATCKIDVYDETPSKVVDTASMTSLGNGGLYYYQNTSLSSSEGYYTALFNCSYNGENGYGTHSFHVAPWANTIEDNSDKLNTILTALDCGVSTTVNVSEMTTYSFTDNVIAGQDGDYVNQEAVLLTYSNPNGMGHETIGDVGVYIKGVCNQSSSCNAFNYNPTGSLDIVDFYFYEVPATNVPRTKDYSKTITYYHPPSDGTLVASFNDQHVTGGTWKTFSINHELEDGKLLEMVVCLDENNDQSCKYPVASSSGPYNATILQGRRGEYSDWYLDDWYYAAGASGYDYKLYNAFNNAYPAMYYTHTPTICSYLDKIDADDQTTNSTISDIYTLVTEINSTTWDTNNYLRNTIYPAVDDLGNMSQEILDNQTGIYNKLVEIQDNVTTTYNEVLVVEDLANDIDSNMASNFTDVRNRLIEINDTTWDTYNNITQTVNPKLDVISSKIDALQSSNNNLEAYLNCSNMPVDSVCWRLDLIQNYTDSVEGNLDSINSSIYNFQDINTGRFDNIDNNLTLIYGDTRWLVNHVADNASVHAKLDSILTYENDINNTVYQTEADLGVMNNTLNSLDNYVRTTLTNYVDGLEGMSQEILDNQTNIYNKLIEIQDNVTNTYNLVGDVKNDVATLSSDMNSNFTWLSAQINDNVTDLQSRLDEINSTTQNTLSNITSVVIPKLNQILDNTTTIYNAVDNLNNEFNCTQMNPSDVCYRLNIIQGYTDNVEGYVLSVNDTLNNYQAIDIGRFDNIDGNLTNIYTDTQYIRANMGLTPSQNDTLYSIQGYVVEINDTTHSIRTDLGIMNNTINNIYGYLQNTIYPAVDELEGMSHQILANQTVIYNKLVEVQNNVTNTYNEVIAIQNQLSAMDNNLNSNFTDIRNRLIEINETTWGTYNNITQTVNPKLDVISNKLDTLQSSNNDLEAYLNCSNMPVDSVCWRLDLIQNYTDSVEGNLDSINSSIYNFQDINTGRFDDIDGNLTLIYGDTQWLVNNVADNASVHAKLNELLTYAVDVNNTVYQTETDLGVMNNTLNSLDSYVHTTLTNYVDDVENMENELLANQTIIYNKVVEVQNNVTNTYNLVSDARADIATLSSDMNSNFTALSTQISALESNMDANFTELDNAIAQLSSDMNSNCTAVQVALSNLEDKLNCDSSNIPPHPFITDTWTDSLDGWSGTGTISLDTDDKLAGNASISFRWDTGVGTHTYTMTTDMDLSSYTSLRAWGKVISKSARIDNITFYTNSSNYYRAELNYTYTEDWEEMTIDKHDFTAYGSPNWGNITYFTITQTATTSPLANALLDKMYWGDDDVCNRLYQIMDYTDTLESSLSFIGASETGRFNSIDGNLTELLANVDEVNQTTQSILLNITTIVEPKLDQILDNTTSIYTAIDDVKSELNCDTVNPSDLCYRVETIQNYTDNIETYVLSVNDTLNSYQAIDINRFDDIDGNLTDIYNDTQYIRNNLATNDSLNASLTYIEELTTEINETSHSIRSDLVGMNSTLVGVYNNTVGAMIPYVTTARPWWFDGETLDVRAQFHSLTGNLINPDSVGVQISSDADIVYSSGNMTNDGIGEYYYKYVIPKYQTGIYHIRVSAIYGDVNTSRTIITRVFSKDGAFTTYCETGYGGSEGHYSSDGYTETGVTAAKSLEKPKISVGTGLTTAKQPTDVTVTGMVLFGLLSVGTLWLFIKK